VEIDDGNPQYDWVVLMWERPRNAGPRVCVTHRKRVPVGYVSNVYHIFGNDSTQLVAFGECATITRARFVPILGREDLDDQVLLRAVETALDLPRMADANDPRVRFESDQERLRRALRRMDVRDVHQFVPYSRDSVTIAYRLRYDELLNVALTYRDGRLTGAVVSTGPRLLRVGS
jgi:hypothetical protein